VSVPSNIAEGDERGGNKEAIQFFYIAKGARAELLAQLEIAGESGYISQHELSEFRPALHNCREDVGRSY